MQVLPEWVIKVLHEWAEHKNSHWNTASSFYRGGRIETFRLVLSVIAGKEADCHGRERGRDLHTQALQQWRLERTYSK